MTDEALVVSVIAMGISTYSLIASRRQKSNGQFYVSALRAELNQQIEELKYELDKCTRTRLELKAEIRRLVKRIKRLEDQNGAG